MKTGTALILLLLSCFAARAEVEPRVLTPANVGQLGWKVEVQEEKDCVRFAVQPPKAILPQLGPAYLTVREGSRLIVSCHPGLRKTHRGDCYTFAVSTQYLDGAEFAVMLDQPDLTMNVSYKIYLVKFVTLRTKELPQNVPRDDNRALTDPP